MGLLHIQTADSINFTMALALTYAKRSEHLSSLAKQLFIDNG